MSGHHRISLAGAAVVISIMAGLTPSYAEEAQRVQGTSAGKDAGTQAIGVYGDKEGIKNNISLPLTTSDTLMKTVDGSKSFNASLSGASSARFLEILIQPASSGDLAVVTIGQDTDNNNTLDHSFNLDVPISGVCANGFISCTPGTWVGCRSYKWTSTDVKASYAEAPITTLGGCFCINSSCGSLLVWENSAVVLQALGGGIIGALQSDNASVMVTEAQADLVSIRYHGKIISKTSPTGTTPSVTATAATPLAAQSYYSSPATLTGDSQNISLTQSTNPDSMYYKMSNSAAFAGSSSVKKCTIRREGTVSTTTDASFSDSGTGSICTDHLVYMRIKKEEDVYTLQLVDTGPSGFSQMHWNCGDDPGGDHWHNFRTFSLPPETGNYQSKLTTALFSVTNINGAGCTPNGSMAMDGIMNGFNIPVMGNAPCPQNGAQTPTFNWSYYFEYKSDTYNENISNQCLTIEADTTCRLRSEKVDNFVTTVTNFNNTGLRPLPTCYKFTGAVKEMDVCNTWWLKEREYVCDSGSTWDLSAAAARHKSILSTAAVTASDLNYTDERIGSSGWETKSGIIRLPASETYDDCSKSCKVKRLRLDTQVSPTGIPSMQRLDQNAIDYYYYPCKADDVCPVQPGDTIVTDCSCLNEFGVASTIMQLMRMGGSDSICSDGARKQL